METCSQEMHIQQRVIDATANVGEPAQQMDDYIFRSTQRLQVITEGINRGETIDESSHQWMLAQVDFLIDSFGDENLELDDEMRSRVLQLVLAIANLNEQIRHQSSLRI
jgi:hypothetical protein